MEGNFFFLMISKFDRAILNVTQITKKVFKRKCQNLVKYVGLFRNINFYNIDVNFKESLFLWTYRSTFSLKSLKFQPSKNPTYYTRKCNHKATVKIWSWSVENLRH